MQWKNRLKNLTNKWTKIDQSIQQNYERKQKNNKRTVVNNSQHNEQTGLKWTKPEQN